MAKYKEIMSRVSVTPQMRERVLSHAADHREHETVRQAEKKKNKRPWIKWASAAAACFLLVIGLGVSHMNEPVTEPVDVTNQGVTEYSSLDELEEAVGFDMPELQELPFEAEKTVYTDADGRARIDYDGADGETVTVSRAKDDGTDISGDYNEYSSVTEETIGSAAVTLKGDKGRIALAQWTKDGFAWSVSADPQISHEEMVSMVKEGFD